MNKGLSHKHPSIWEMYGHQVRRIQLEVDYYLTFLQRLLVSNDMNIWLSCLLSTQRFLVTNPLCVNDVTWIPSKVKKLRSKEDMANHLGTAVFARVLLWGFGLYISRDTRYVPMEYQKSLDNGRQKQEGIIALTNDRALPNIKSMQQMLKSSVTKLSVPMFTLLQSILADFWALQSFAEPYRYEERLPQRLPNIISSTDDVDQNGGKELSALRKNIKQDMEIFRAANQKLKGTPTQRSAVDSSILENGDDDNLILSSSSSSSSSSSLSSSSSSSTSSSSSSLKVQMEIQMMSPSAINTPKENQAKTSFQKDDNSKMTKDANAESRRKKQESASSTSGDTEKFVSQRQQRNKNNRKDQENLDSR